MTDPDQDYAVQVSLAYRRMAQQLTQEAADTSRHERPVYYRRLRHYAEIALRAARSELRQGAAR